MGTLSELRSIFVTGASTGIGEAAALHLDRLGYRVFAGVRKADDAEKLRRAGSDRLVPIFVDVTDEDMIAKAAAQVSESVGDHGLAGLVNNAGVAVAAPLEFIPISELRRQLDINVIGQIAVTQAFLPLIRQATGRVVFVSSISGRIAAPLLGPYAASKFSLGALADSLRRELLPWDIRVSLVEPGRIETPIWEKSVAAADALAAQLDPQAQEYYGKAMDANRARAMKARGGTPVEVVSRVIEKALTARSPKTRYLVGRDARAGALLASLLPDKWLDAFIARQRGIRR